ncbi:MAG: hypothetical protein ACK5LJ_07950 [Paracoccus sp. (in: a-proteobacteria)]
MSSKLKTSLIALTMMGVLGSSFAVAQTAPATDAPAVAEVPAEAAPAAAAVAVPELLQGAGFTEVTSRPGRRGGLLVTGTLAETGKDFDAMVNKDGKLVGIRTAEGAALPQALRDALLPEAARGNAIISEIAVLSAIGSRDEAVMISGQDASGDKVRIGFDTDGQLMRFERGDMMHGGPGMMGKRGGKDGMHGDRDGKGKHGDRDGRRGNRGGDHGGKGPHGGNKGPGNGMMPPNGAMQQGMSGQPGMGGQPEQQRPFDEAALRSAAEAAGYTDLGAISAGHGRAVTVEGVNPQGEEVLIFVNPQGEVMRETAR